MKVKKLLSVILSAATLLSSAALPIFAEEYTEIVSETATDSNAVTVDIQDGKPKEASGTGWTYDSAKDELTLKSGYSYYINGYCTATVENYGTIEGGSFGNTVNNCKGGIINGGLYKKGIWGYIGSVINDAYFPITYSGIEFAEGIEVQATFSYAKGLTLPTEGFNISDSTKKFDAWYDNAEMSGDPITEIAPKPDPDPVTVYARLYDQGTFPTWDEQGKSAESETDYAVDGNGDYHIYTATGLSYIAHLVNNGNDLKGKTVVLEDNIDLKDGNVYGYGENVIARNSWIPIDGFAGTFEGNGHTISNLYINCTNKNAGLFGDNLGTIKNLTVSGEIKLTSSSTSYAGGIAALTSGIIEGCVNNADITVSGSGTLYAGGITGAVGTSIGDIYCSTVKGCANNGSVTGTNSTGGIAGSLLDGQVTLSGYTAVINYCRNTGAVNDGKWSGGIVGKAKGNGAPLPAVVNCWNEGAVAAAGNSAAGIVAYSTGINVYNCYNTGSVGTADKSANNTGGIVGLSYSSKSNAANCYNYGDIKSGTYKGQIIGNLTYGAAQNCYYFNGSDVKACGKASKSATASDLLPFIKNEENTYEVISDKNSGEADLLNSALNNYVKESAPSYHSTWEIKSIGDLPTFADKYYSAVLFDIKSSDEETAGVEATGGVSKTYNIYLAAAEAATVTSFDAGEFSIVNSGAANAEIAGTDGLTVAYDNAAGKYKIYRTNGAASPEPTGDATSGYKIKLGTVTLTGSGSGTLCADDIAMYKTNDDGAQNTSAEMLTTSKELSYDITAPKAELKVVVSFPNSIVNQVTDYQDMKVTISDGDLTEDISYSLGSDSSANVKWGNETQTYTLTVADKLTKGINYAVKVSGAGYRTAEYYVLMDADKTLNFWNNYKNTPVAIEENKDTSKASTTFLAGDIVKDAQINIYDLSAVVSYFGTENTVTAASNYAKYDLNRAGKIDSKDIAYVLNSWGK